MKRRTFILTAGIGAGLLTIPPALYVISPSLLKYAGKLIYKELGYLKLDENGVDRYVNDYFASANNNIVTNLKWKALYYLGAGPESSNQIYDMIKYYLLSTDFFINKTDETKVVKYLGLYSPYKSPIPNPYSYILYPPEPGNF